MNRGLSIAIGAALVLAGTVLLMRSKPTAYPVGQYTATAVIQISRPAFDGPSASEAMRLERSILESPALLDTVATSLNLSAKWGGPNGPAPAAEVRERLKASIEVTANPVSEQIFTRVSGPDKNSTEEMAQSILGVYDELRRTRLRSTKPKAIVTLEEQLEEIEPKLRLAQETMEKIGSEITVDDVSTYVAPRNESTLLDRIREGKEEEPPDNNSTFYYGNEPAPKNETPEQAKRRIYLKARRAAEVFGMRKERLEARLEYERSRTSTTESARTQVVQQPEAVLQATGVHRAAAPKGPMLAGWGCIAFGGLFLVGSVLAPRQKTSI